MNGSNTTSPGCVYSAITRFGSSKGNGAGWATVDSVVISQTLSPGTVAWPHTARAIDSAIQVSSLARFLASANFSAIFFSRSPINSSGRQMLRVHATNWLPVTLLSPPSSSLS